jgi:hypothetical protein
MKEKINFKKAMVMVLIMVCVMSGLIGCGRSNLVGAWELEDAVGISRSQLAQRVEFFSDGRGVMDGMHGFTWSSEGGRVVITSFWGGAYVYSYRISGSTLTIIHDDHGEVFSTARRVR